MVEWFRERSSAFDVTKKLGTEKGVDLEDISWVDPSAVFSDVNIDP